MKLMKSGKSLLAGLIACLMLVVTGCQAVGGVDLNEVLTKTTATAAASNGSITFDLDLKDSAFEGMSLQEAKQLKLFTHVTLRFDEIKALVEGQQAQVKGRLTISDGTSVGFDLFVNKTELIVQLEGVATPFVIDLQDQFSTSEEDEEMAASLEALVLDLQNQLNQFLVKKLPNPKNLKASTVSEVIGGVNTPLVRLQAELNPADLWDWSQELLEGLVADKEGLHALVLGIYETLEKNMQSDVLANLPYYLNYFGEIPSEIIYPVEPEEDYSDWTDEDWAAYFAAYAEEAETVEAAEEAAEEAAASSEVNTDDEAVADEVQPMDAAAVAEAVTESIHTFLVELKEEATKLSSGDSEEAQEFKEFLKEDFKLAVDLYINSKLDISKYTYALSYVPSEKLFEDAPFNKASLVITGEQWEMTEAQVKEFKRPELPEAVLTQEDLDKLEGYQFARLFGSESDVSKVLFHTFRVGEQSYSSYSDSWYNPPMITPQYVTIVPLRDVADALGVELTYIPETRTIEAYDDATYNTFKVQIGSDKAMVGDKEVQWSAPFTTIDGVGYVPAKDLAAVLGAKIQWNTYEYDEETYKEFVLERVILR